MDDPLDDFTLGSFAYRGVSHDVYRSGEGPAVIVIAEMPGITPEVATFARRVRDLGCTVLMPALFGDPGREASGGYVAKSFGKACVSKEFAAFATRPHRARSSAGCARSPPTPTASAAARAWVRSACASPAGSRSG